MQIRQRQRKTDSAYWYCHVYRIWCVCVCVRVFRTCKVNLFLGIFWYEAGKFLSLLLDGGDIKYKRPTNERPVGIEAFQGLTSALVPDYCRLRANLTAGNCRELPEFPILYPPDYPAYCPLGQTNRELPQITGIPRYRGISNLTPRSMQQPLRILGR